MQVRKESAGATAPPSTARALFGLVFLAALAGPAGAGPVEIHYAPVENLERTDVALLRSARARIDMAAYTLTDWAVIDALTDARRRGVALRIVLDPSQRHALGRLQEIAADIRMKTRGPYMHLKSYLVDGRTLRSGSANFSASGLKRQDNDIVILREPSTARAFEQSFERIWTRAKPLQLLADPLANGAGGRAATRTGPASRLCAAGNAAGRDGRRTLPVSGDRAYDRLGEGGRADRSPCARERPAAGRGSKTRTR